MVEETEVATPATQPEPVVEETPAVATEEAPADAVAEQVA